MLVRKTSKKMHCEDCDAGITSKHYGRGRHFKSQKNIKKFNIKLKELNDLL